MKTINCTKTKIEDLGGCDSPCQRVSVQGNEVEVVESFVYFGSLSLVSSEIEELQTFRWPHGTSLDFQLAAT